MTKYCKKSLLGMGCHDKHWGIYALHQDQERFLSHVIECSHQELIDRYGHGEDLIQMLQQTLDKEFHCMKVHPWSCDPKDNGTFWTSIQDELNRGASASQLLRIVIQRYAYATSSQFSIAHYKRLEKMATWTFKTLLRPHGLCKKDPTRGNLLERFHICGEFDMVRSLSKVGTLVFVPSHVSNWDSIVLGFAMYHLGIPPLSWGAGLNLFENFFFRAIFGQLGAYKVDRRRKTIPYLQTQKNYVAHLLERGCHTTFYPGGGRNRQGTVDRELRRGFLRAVFQTQCHMYQNRSNQSRKLFLVPVVISYHTVPDAPELGYRARSGSIPWIGRVHALYKKLVSWKNMLMKGSEIFVNIGQPLDVVGHDVDVDGQSYDRDHVVDLVAYLSSLTTEDQGQCGHYVNILSRRIVGRYERLNQVLSSHLVAFVAYELIKERSLEQSMAIGMDHFMALLAAVYQKLSVLYSNGEIDFTPVVMRGNLEAIVSDGLYYLGNQHATPPLAMGGRHVLLVQDKALLLYYHNKLVGYGLERGSEYQ